VHTYLAVKQAHHQRHNGHQQQERFLRLSHRLTDLRHQLNATRIVPAIALTQETLRRMEHDGLHATILDPDTVHPAVSLEQAEQRFHEDVSKPVEQVSLTRITVDAYLNHDGERIINNRLVWVALIPNAPDPCFAPPGSSCGSSERADWVVLIDATTGDFLQSRTL